MQELILNVQGILQFNLEPLVLIWKRFGLISKASSLLRRYILPKVHAYTVRWRVSKILKDISAKKPSFLYLYQKIDEISPGSKDGSVSDATKVG